ncbi:MAG: response regulator [Candidatus Hodarchaeales archaeon]
MNKEESSLEDPQKKKIILIEDSEDHIFLLKRELSKQGFDLDITIAKSATDAEEYLNMESLPFDIVILDYSLPEKTGLEILDSIKQKSLNDFVQVILTTGMGSEKVAAEALRLGADDYIIKEVNFASQVAKAVSHALEKIHLREEIQKREEALKLSELKYRTLIQEANDGIAIINFEEKIIEANQKLLKIFEKTMDHVKGNHYLELFPLESREKIRRLSSDISSRSRRIQVPIGFKRVDGKEIQVWGEISVNTAEILEGNAYAIMIVRDITENKKLEKILRDQTQRLEGILLQEKQ